MGWCAGPASVCIPPFPSCIHPLRSFLLAGVPRYGRPLFAVESKQPLSAFDTLGFSLAYELGATNILEMLSLAGIPISWRERHAWEAQQHQQHRSLHQSPTPLCDSQQKQQLGNEQEGGGGGEGTGELRSATVESTTSPGHTAQPFPWSPGHASGAAYEELKGELGGSDGPWDVGTGRSLPLIFAGGPTATSNPEPFADFFDFFAIGDGEECLVEIAQCLEGCKDKGLTRLQTLITLATTVQGVYVPQLYQTLPGWGAAALPRLEGVPTSVLRRVATPDPLDQIGLVPFTTTVHDRLTVEIRRGCTRGCRFCQPGMLTRPARDVEPERVVEAVEQGMRKTGYTEFSLLSLSCSDYLALPSVGIQIKNRLKGEPISLSLPSQRVDRFNDDIANIVGGTRKGSLTFAPEAGTQRLRDIINKGLTDEELLRGIKAAWDRGWRQVKLYFMIGLPGETDEDVLGIARTVKWLQSECRRGRKSYLGIKLTVSNFTPKPHTPFQWHSVSTEELERKQRLLRGALARLPGVKYYLGDVRLSAMEDFIGRGDRSIGPVIRRAWELGATNDAWWNNVDECYQSWNAAIAEAGVEWKYRRVLDGEWDVLEHLGDARFRGQGGKGRVDTGEMKDARLDAPLPWDIINTGIAKWWLKADLQRALEATTVPDCSHSGECSKCGVCSDEFGDNVVAEVPEIPPFDGDFQPDRTRGQRLRVQFAKLGSMVLIGHLDLTRLFDRALRRAALPVCYDNGIHSLPRLSSALPLPLGHSSSCELIDIELTTTVPIAQFQRRLQAQLPPEVPLLQVCEEPVFRMDGKNEDSLSKLVHGVEYLLAVSVGAPHPQAQAQAPLDGSPQASAASATAAAPLAGPDGFASVGTPLVAEWAEAVLALGSFRVQSSSKRTGKFRVNDLRALLRELQVLPPSSPLPLAFAQSCPEVVAALQAQSQRESQAGGALQVLPGGPASGGGSQGQLAEAHGRGEGEGERRGESAVVLLRYVGSHSGEGGSLRPEGVLAMLEEVSQGSPLRLLHAHRSAVLLRPASRPQIDHALLRSVANDDAFRALYRRWDGSSRLQDEQPKDPLEHSRRAQEAAKGNGAPLKVSAAV